MGNAGSPHVVAVGTFQHKLENTISAADRSVCLYASIEMWAWGRSCSLTVLLWDMKAES